MAEVNIDIQLEAIKRELQAVQAELKQVGQAGSAAFSAIGQSAQKAGNEVDKVFAPEGNRAVKYAQEIEDLRAEYAKLQQASKTLRGALSQAQDPRAIKQYSAAVAQAEAGMRKLEQAGRAVGLSQKDLQSQLSVTKTIATELFSAFSVAGVIAAVGGLVKQAVTLAANYEKVRVSFTAFLGSAEKADKLLTDLNKFASATPFDDAQVREAGKALLGFGVAAEQIVPTLDRIGTISAATGKDFNELALIYGKARTAGVLYAEDINQLVEAGIPVIEEFSKQLGVGPEQVKKLGSEGKISFQELELAFFNLTSAGGRFYGQMSEQSKTLIGQTDQLKSGFNNLLRELGETLTPALVVVVNKLNDLVASWKTLTGSDTTFFDRANSSILLLTGGLVNVENIAKRLKGTLSDTQQGAFFDPAKAEEEQKQRTEIEKKAEETRIKLAADADKKKREAALKEAEKYAKERNRLLVESLADGEEKEIALETLKYKELRNELRKYHIDTTQAERQYQDNVYKIRVKYRILDYAEQQAALQLEKDQLQAGYDELNRIAEAGARALNETQQRELESEKDRVALSRETFEGRLLAARRFFFEKQRTDQEVADFEKEQAKQREIFELEAQKTILQKTLEFEADLTDAQKAGIEQRISNINEQIKQVQDSVGQVKPKAGFNIWKDVLGLDPDKDRELIDLTKQAIGEAVQQFENLAAARVEAAQAAVQAAETQVQAAEEALQREIEIAQLGFASNVDARRKDLEDAENARKTALAQQKKAQRAQLVLDAAQQASSIAVASANIIKGWSGPSFGLGLIAAFAQIASIVALIKSTKARAAQFGEGGGGAVGSDGVIVGPSHDRGGVPMEVEGGEFFSHDGKKFAVVSKKNTSKYYDLLQAINADSVPDIVDQVNRITGGIQMRPSAVDSATRTRPGVIQVQENTRPLLEEQNQILREQLRLERERVQYVDMGDHVLKIQNGRETKIYKRG